MKSVRVMILLACLTGCGRGPETPTAPVGAPAVIAPPPAPAPADEEALFQRAKKLYEENKFEEACSLFNDVIRLNPNHVEALKSRAGCYLGMDNRRKQTPEEKRSMAMKAKADCDHALRVDPHYARAFHNRGLAHWQLGDRDAAVDDLTTAIRHDPALTVAYRVRGDLYRERAEDHKALGDYDRVIEREPANVAALYGRGCVCQKLTRHEAAVTDFRTVMRLDPHFHVDVWNRLMNLLESTKQWDDCVRHQSDLLELVRDPKSRSICYSNRGLFHERRSDFYTAISDYSESIKCDPNNDRSRKQLSLATDRVRALKGSVTAILVVLELDERVKHVPVQRSPPYQLPESAAKVVEDTIRVSHAVTVSDTWKDESVKQGAVKAWFVEASATIRTAVERSTGRTAGEESERKRSVTLHGPTPGPGICVVWVDCYRTGKARMVIDGLEVVLPFEYKDDFDLIAEPFTEAKAGKS